LLCGAAALFNALLQLTFVVVHAVGCMQQFAIDAYREAGAGLECCDLPAAAQRRYRSALAETAAGRA
jgi:hypothetical protein